MNRTSRSAPAARGVAYGDDATLDKRQLLSALTALRNGDLSARLPADWVGTDGKIADTFNEIVALNASQASELKRLSRLVGKEGKLGQRMA
ncbi:MAG TPA: hypothetical protein VJW76_03185, partial [Verrucomicrobiae bacterium]|nr:hypothetical protein [Verrucomicrobiae bacterium]